MSAFLSPGWVADLDEAARAATAPADVSLVVQQVVVDGRDGAEAAYAIRIGDGGVRVTEGRADDAHLTLTQDRETAAAIARGELSAQAAFLEGRLQVGGDLDAARAGARALTALDDLFAAPRAATTW